MYPKLPIRLNKPRAKTYVLFEVNLAMKSDGWFINVNTYVNKDNTLKGTELIILKDVNDWLRNYTSRGWIVQDDI